jgi:hypothetical protein
MPRRVQRDVRLHDQRAVEGDERVAVQPLQAAGRYRGSESRLRARYWDAVASWNLYGAERAGFLRQAARQEEDGKAAEG